MSSARGHAYYKDSPDLVEAREFWSQGDYRRALRLFERSAKKEPYNLLALKDAAYAFGQHFEIATASKYIKRMVALVGSDPGGLHLVSQAWRDAYRSEEASRFLRYAVATGNAHPETYLQLAIDRERSHQLDEAMEFVDRFLYLKPEAPEGVRLKAMILRRRGEVDEAKALYTRLAELCGKGDLMVLAQGINEWANILDREGDYESAFFKIRESKEILSTLPETKVLLEREYREREWFDRLLLSLTSDHVEGWARSDERPAAKNVILTGCPRSGTTLIEKVLDAHSEIVSAEELGVFSNFVVPYLFSGCDEDEFTADTLSNLPQNVARRQSRRYFSYTEAAMGEKIRGRVLIDKVPSSTMVIPFLLKLLPNTHILYALRDPRDIVVSSYMCWMHQNNISACFNSVEETVQRTMVELKWGMMIKKLTPRERWHETRYEDTVQGVADESKKILQWLELPWQDEVADYREQLDERGVISPTYESVREPVYQSSVNRWKNYEQFFEPYFESMADLLQEMGYLE